MESRMEKYYTEDLSNFERTKKYEELYKDVSGELSDLDKLPVPDNANEIDLEGLREIISSRDEYRKNRELSRTLKMSLNEDTLDEVEKRENKIYDINVLLENAKSEINRSAAVTGSRMINANFLTTMEDASIPSSDDATEISEEVVAKRSDFNGDSLPLDILMDLKGSDNTIVTDPIVKDEVTMIKELKDGETFYSDSFNFSKKDFDDEDDEDEEDDEFYAEGSHNGIKLFFLVLAFLLLAGAIYLILINYVL